VRHLSLQEAGSVAANLVEAETKQSGYNLVEFNPVGVGQSRTHRKTGPVL